MGNENKYEKRILTYRWLFSRSHRIIIGVAGRSSDLLLSCCNPSRRAYEGRQWYVLQQLARAYSTG